MSRIRPGVIALILALTVVTSGVTAVQSAGGEESLVSASADAVLEVQKSFQGESTKDTKQSGLSANLESTAGGPKAQCTQGEILAKYNLDTESGEWVYEKGPAGDVFSITNEESDADGPIKISWTSSGPSVTYLEAQYDGQLYTEDYDPPTTSGTLPKQEYAYSNVVFCGANTFQVDLIEGTPRDTLENNDDLYRPEDRLVANEYVSSEGDTYSAGGKNTGLAAECIEVTSPVSVDASTDPSEVSITFDVASDTKCEGLEVSFAAYELPGQRTSFGLPQVLADSETVTVSAGETVTLTVALKDTSN